MKVKTYLISCLAGIVAMILLVSSFVYFVDPYFQYHVPRKELAYNMEMNSFAYYNAGIAKNFSYDTIVTGSSMSRAMQPSYIDKIFGGKTVKLSMAEARGIDYKTLFSTVENNVELKTIIMGLDTFAFVVDKDYSAYDKPMYLYDDNILNDTLYLANMDGVVESLKVVRNTLRGGKTTTMDEYQNYELSNTFSRDQVMKLYWENIDYVQTVEIDMQDTRERILDNLKQNLIPMIEKRSDVEFVFYYPPYSIAKWGLTGNLNEEIEYMKILARELIKYPNVSLYFFQGEKEIITELDHYMDTIHFDGKVANQIIDYISDEKNKMTQENYEEQIDEFGKFIKEYDYLNM